MGPRNSGCDACFDKGAGANSGVEVGIEWVLESGGGVGDSASLVPPTITAGT